MTEILLFAMIWYDMIKYDMLTVLSPFVETASHLGAPPNLYLHSPRILYDLKNQITTSWSYSYLLTYDCISIYFISYIFLPNT